MVKEHHNALVDYYTCDGVEPDERKYFESLEKGDIILDLCCGTGRIAIALAKNGFLVRGIDLANKAIKFAQEKAECYKGIVDFIIGDATKIPFKDKVFDRVICTGASLDTLASSSERLQSILEMARVLKDDGTFFIQTNYFLPLKKLIWRTAGFVIKLPVRALKSLLGKDCTGLYFGDSFCGIHFKIKVAGFSHTLSKRELNRYMESAKLEYKLEYKIETDKEYMGDKSFKAKFSRRLITVGHKNR